jgi:hypothetical protein
MNNGDQLAIRTLEGIKALYQFSEKINEVIGEPDHVYEIMELFEESLYEYLEIPKENEIYCRDYVSYLMQDYNTTEMTAEEMLDILKEHVNELREELL